MRFTLFCKNPYAFGILMPLYNQLVKDGEEVLWYFPAKIAHLFPLENEKRISTSIVDVKNFRSDVLFVPGNEVPHYLRGVKVQIFHGLAGEKKGHFRIRHYFDLYLTQGPYFTKRFKEFAMRYKNFVVKETGWCKLDPLFSNMEEFNQKKKEMLEKHGKKNLVLYAPTFSPSLTSAKSAMDDVFQLAEKESVIVCIKFHDLMDKEIVNAYKIKANAFNNVKVIKEPDILPYLKMADILISDTSSVVYEFILLNKPVITINSKSENIYWENIKSSKDLLISVAINLSADLYSSERESIIKLYHPYSDGLSSNRMINRVKEFISQHGVPERRTLSFFRRRKMIRMFGNEPN
jgi:CDP-ribitol ribitolphosphotransferase / teichoic acid ribitol-phosphate polymerase